MSAASSMASTAAGFGEAAARAVEQGASDPAVAPAGVVAPNETDNRTAAMTADNRRPRPAGSNRVFMMEPLDLLAGKRITWNFHVG